MSQGGSVDSLSVVFC